VVAKLWSQRGHFESTLILHLFRLSGVGRVSEPAFSRNESCLDSVPYPVLGIEEFCDCSYARSAHACFMQAHVGKLLCRTVP